MERAHLVPLFRPPETPADPMEFLSRSWSVSALEFSRALAPNPLNSGVGGRDRDFPVDQPEEAEAQAVAVSRNPFPFTCSETSQLVMEHIMSQSQEVSPHTSGRQSHSSEPLSDSPPVSPPEIDDTKYFPVNHLTGGSGQCKNSAASGTGLTGGKPVSVGRWLKDRKEKKKEEVRAHNAELHAAVSVAGVAAAVAAIAAATAASSRTGKDDQITKTDMAVASAATLVAAQCVEAAEGLGAERDHLASVVSSAVNVGSGGDIMTLTAAAATALRAAAMLKARAEKEVWNAAAITDKVPASGCNGNGSSNGSLSGELAPEENFLGICSRELLARGGELLKRTRNGDLHWKIVSVYINKLGHVILKLKSRHVAGTVTKKKKNVVVEVLKDTPAWPGRHLLDDGEHRRYFGLKTVARGIVEFECMNQREYDIWTQGVSRLLTIAANRHMV